MGTCTSGSEVRAGATTDRKVGTALRSDTYYWAVDLLQEEGLKVHLAHPAGNDWGKRRVNDERDARDLADLLRLGRLAEAWIAPKETRELRELVRYRYKLVCLRTGLKAQAHAVMAKEGVLPKVGWMFGPGGNEQLDHMELAESYSLRVSSLRELIAVLRWPGSTVTSTVA